MIEKGTVVEAAAGSVSVRVTASKECAGCGACSAGRTGGDVLSGVGDPFGARPGDTVEIEFPAKGLFAVGVVYIVPVLALIVGYAAGTQAATLLRLSPDMSGALVGLVCLAAAFFGMSLAGKGTLSSERYRPRVHAIISRSK